MRKRLLLIAVALIAALGASAAGHETAGLETAGQETAGQGREVSQGRTRPQPRQRLLHNNDGTDLLANLWHGRRPLCLADLEACVDLVAEGGATTFMMCTGSDFAYYRSKYSRVFGDDLSGALPNLGDTLMMNYYRNFCNLEKEGADFIGATLARARHNGMETFLTYRMNDCHMADTRKPRTIYTSDFWMAHPECWMGGKEGWRGWHADGAFDFAHQAVREHKYNMIAEQIDLYGGLIDGYELDFLRFPIFFKAGKGPENAELMTGLVRRVRAKLDSAGAELGRRLLLAVRVPDVWQSCLDNGLDVRAWVAEGLVDFISIGVYWRGDPSVNADAFRKESGIESRAIPVYACVDDGSFDPREVYTHGMLRGAASFALSHGADGIYLFNYFLAEYNMGRFAPEAGGKACRIRTPQLMRELASAKALSGRSKSYSYYSGKVEFGLKYKSPMPLRCSAGAPSEITFDVADKLGWLHRPEHVYVMLRCNSSDAMEMVFNGARIPECGAESAAADGSQASLGLAALYGRALNLKAPETVRCFEVPRKLLRHGSNTVTLTPASAARISRLELILDYGAPAKHGYN